MAYEHSQTDDRPVTDWLHDWDWLDPSWGEDAISIWNDIREQCPVASTERYGRAFLPVTMQAVQAIAQDTEHFSSWRVSVARPDAPRELLLQSRQTLLTITGIAACCCRRSTPRQLP